VAVDIGLDLVSCGRCIANNLSGENGRVSLFGSNGNY
jgi:hypothetical protein